MSHQPEVVSRQFEEILGDIEATIDAIETASEFPDGHSPRELRIQVSKLQLFNNEV